MPGFAVTTGKGRALHFAACSGPRERPGLSIAQPENAPGGIGRRGEGEDRMCTRGAGWRTRSSRSFRGTAVAKPRAIASCAVFRSSSLTSTRLLSSKRPLFSAKNLALSSVSATCRWRYSRSCGTCGRKGAQRAARQSKATTLHQTAECDPIATALRYHQFRSLGNRQTPVLWKWRRGCNTTQRHFRAPSALWNALPS